MENLAQVAPLIILFPSIGAFINYFWGARMGERASALIGTFAAAMAFVIAVLLYSYLRGNDFQPAVIDPPFLDSWIRIDSAGINITWQTRVDTLSVSMMMFVTFVGTLIHVYASGYMHGDPRFYRFFAYLNMFLAFMLVLVSGNNFLMLFVGWEGVGLCSYLLIGFWWDKPKGVGWSNGNAARKAFIVNRIGDFGMLMAMFLMFWTFGTLDFYKPSEITNVSVGADHDTTSDAYGDEEEHADDIDHDSDTEEQATDSEEHGAAGAAEDGHGDESGHGSDDHDGVPEATLSHLTEGIEPGQLGVFGQTELMFAEQEAAGEETIIDFGAFELSLETAIVLITLFMLLGASGKSAQIPLFVWLPDAMAGPTPVSALIHAATMVTAGVYMMVRSNVMFHHAEFTSFVVTMVGASTALIAGFIAVGQWDIKRVLAYSTISQLGFMVAAVGLGAYPAAMFHMITHAFFKALLFLGSGSVIHGVEHGHHHASHHHDDDLDPQDMRNMGGLRSKMPITYWTYLIGTLALAGIWPFAGFWSKDEILADAWQVGFRGGELEGYIALGMLLLAAGFTAFYMWRQIEMVFHGKPRTEAAEHASESGPSMTISLIILAFFGLLIGFINIPGGVGSLFTFGFDGSIGRHALGDFLEHSIAHFHLPPFQTVIALSALTLGLGAIFLARSIYGGDKAVVGEDKDPLQINLRSGPIWTMANARLWWDEVYYTLFEANYNRLSDFLANTIDWNFWHDYVHDRVILRGYNAIAKLLAIPFDLGIIDGIVNGLGRLVVWFSGSIRRVQTGYVRTYVLALFLGVVAIVVIMLIPLIEIG